MSYRLARALQVGGRVAFGPACHHGVAKYLSAILSRPAGHFARPAAFDLFERVQDDQRREVGNRALAAPRFSKCIAKKAPNPTGCWGTTRDKICRAYSVFEGFAECRRHSEKEFWRAGGSHKYGLRSRKTKTIQLSNFPDTLKYASNFFAQLPDHVCGRKAQRKLRLQMADLRLDAREIGGEVRGSARAQ